MTTEYDEQVAWIEWVRTVYPKITIFHIPNGQRRHIGAAVKLKKMGVLRGVPDIYCLDYKLFIEFKKDRKGRVSKEQKAFFERAIETNHRAMVFYGFEDGVEKFTKLTKELQDEKTTIHSVDDTKRLHRT